MGVILDGRALSDKIQSEVALEVANLKAQGIFPKLCVILVGENPASLSYVNMKHKACERTGIESQIIKFDENISQEFLLGEIARLNADKSVSGILVQLPLPKHINTDAILEAIWVKKDVDGFHPYNVGRLFSDCKNSPSLAEGDKGGGFNTQNNSSTKFSNNESTHPLTPSAREGEYNIPILAPATPLGVMELLKAYHIEVSGKNVAIIGASNIVGKPLAALMLNAGATISVCHILTKDISIFTKTADIVCVGVGKVNLITADMIKEGAIVIDIGINKIDGKIKGDVDFERIAQKASFITPVPGGVGPMTIAMLLKNTLLCAEILTNSSNLSLGNHCVDLQNFGASQTSSLVSSPKFCKNSTSTTANTSIVCNEKSAKNAESTSKGQQ